MGAPSSRPFDSLRAISCLTVPDLPEVSACARKIPNLPQSFRPNFASTSCHRPHDPIDPCPESRGRMLEVSPLVATLVAGLGLAFIFGILSNRVQISPLVGYLLAGVAAGPYTPGFVGDAQLAQQLAEIGVVLLM